MKTALPVSQSTVGAGSPTEQIVPGLARYWLDDHRIVVFKATQTTRQVVDAWIDTVKLVMAEWPSDHPYLVIHDFREGNIALTPYARARAAELIPIGVHVPGYAAIVLPKSFVAQIIRIFMQNRKSGGIENRLFLNYADGLAWLRKAHQVSVVKQSHPTGPANG